MNRSAAPTPSLPLLDSRTLPSPPHRQPSPPHPIRPRPSPALTRGSRARTLAAAALGLLLSFSGLPLARAAATTARLLIPVETVKPGDTFLAGIELSMKPRWHTYWRHGGDSGAPTTVAWTLPEGVAAGELRWPPPERYEDASLATFVYHGTTTLLVPITVGPSVPPGPLALSATVKWLECEKLCLPGSARIEAALRVGETTTPSPDAPAIQSAEGRLPKPLPRDAATASWDGPPVDDERPLVIRWRPPGTPQSTPDFLPYGGEGFEVGTTTEVLPADPGTPGTVLLRKKVRKSGDGWPGIIEGLLVELDPARLPRSAFEARFELSANPAGTVVATPVPSTTPAPTSPPTRADPGLPEGPQLSLARALILGLLGGLLLNIMPCVLPVIALKILGFVRQSGSQPAEVRKLGLIYALGVWFSFLVLAGAVIAVKKAAGFAGWGMQFGNPVFLVALTSLILLVALSLFGVFEINVGGRALDAAGDLAGKEGPAGAFFNGMLAVALATPCTAPFLGPALGYAFAADAGTIVAVFSAIAFGLAAPYVVLSWQPAFLRFLPKPGPWMERFKVAMGFPMLATALWLYTLAAVHFGKAGSLWLGIFLVTLALAAWIWGEFVQRGRRHPTAAMIVSLSVAVLGFWLALERELRWRDPHEPSPTAVASPNHPEKGIPWQPWSREAVAAARQSGRPVFVDFTADWCLTCKANERLAIDIPAVREKLRTINAVALKGDYTRLPPEITEELRNFRRAGVPLVVVYPRDPTKAPRALPEVLTPGLVLEELAKAIL